MTFYFNIYKIFYTLYEQYKNQLQNFKIEDKEQINSDDENDYLEQIDELNDIYNLYFDKLEYIKKIDDTDNQTQKKIFIYYKKNQ